MHMEMMHSLSGYFAIVLHDIQALAASLFLYRFRNVGCKRKYLACSLLIKLVDIIGLLSDRDYNVPTTLPTTLSGWIASMVALLGENFTNCWAVDEPLGQIALTVNSADELKDMNCGSLLRYLCMAAQAAFRADAVTGKLRVFLPEGTEKPAGGQYCTDQVPIG